MQWRSVHAGDLTSEAAHALTWNVGDLGLRYQEIAIVGERVVGSWMYDVQSHRGRAIIVSSRTEVTPRYRRKGLARMLWFAGIARWNPTRIDSVIGSDEGAGFLATMAAEIAYRAPGVFLCVKRRAEDASWEDRCWWTARELLNKLGERDRVRAPVTKALKAVQ